MSSLAILATIFAAIVGTTSATVKASEKTPVDVDANGYDTRTSGSGCSPNGCVPANTRDEGGIAANSRWSCKGDILDSSDQDEGCCITYTFVEPQQIDSIKIAFHKGDEKIQTMDMYENGVFDSTITSTGRWLGHDWFRLWTRATEEIKLCMPDPESNTDVWLSITDVQFTVD